MGVGDRWRWPWSRRGLTERERARLARTLDDLSAPDPLRVVHAPAQPAAPEVPRAAALLDADLVRLREALTLAPAPPAPDHRLVQAPPEDAHPTLVPAAAIESTSPHAAGETGAAHGDERAHDLKAEAETAETALPEAPVGTNAAGTHTAGQPRTSGNGDPALRLPPLPDAPKRRRGWDDLMFVPGALPLRPITPRLGPAEPALPPLVLERLDRFAAYRRERDADIGICDELVTARAWGAPMTDAPVPGFAEMAVLALMTHADESVVAVPDEARPVPLDGAHGEATLALMEEVTAAPAPGEAALVRIAELGLVHDEGRVGDQDGPDTTASSDLDPAAGAPWWDDLGRIEMTEDLDAVLDEVFEEVMPTGRVRERRSGRAARRRGGRAAGRAFERAVPTVQASPVPTISPISSAASAALATAERSDPLAQARRLRRARARGGRRANPVAAVFRLLTLRVPRTRIPLAPVVFVLALAGAGSYTVASYNYDQGETFLRGVRRYVPEMGSELADGFAAEKNLRDVATRIEAGKGRESIQTYATAARNLADRAKTSQRRLQDMQLTLASFDQAPFLPHERASHVARVLAGERWYPDAQTVLALWLRRGDGAAKLANTVATFLGNDVGREFRADPASARLETMVRLEELGRQLARTSDDLNEIAVNSGADSPAARLYGRFRELAELAGQGRTAVDTKDYVAFKRIGAEYEDKARALQSDLLKELTVLAQPQSGGVAVETLIELAAKTVSEVNLR